MFRRAALALATTLGLFSLAFASPAHADQEFTIKLRGITVGKLLIEGSNGGDSYDYQSSFRTTGVVGVVANVRFVMRSLGNMRGHVMVPRAYVEQMNTGYRESNGRVSFSDDDGRWDPNTALVYMFGPRPKSDGCAFKRTLYDGERTNDLSFAETEHTSTKLACFGAMTRVAGYTAEEMATRPQHKLTVHYELVGDTYEFVGADAHTIYGLVKILPR